MPHRDTVIHLVAGGVAGTAGAIVTCPLEVVKTRQQSSAFHVHNVNLPKIASSEAASPHVTCKTMLPEHQRRKLTTMAARHNSQIFAISHCAVNKGSPQGLSILQCIRHIVEHEGPRALFKGLGPNLVGVAPSRAIYFCAYSQSKEFLNNAAILLPDSAAVHVCAASCAGFVACSATNPIWFVKTRLQLDHHAGKTMTALQVVRRIYRTSGIRGFYKGITASYWGISETVIHFVIYEAIKARLLALRAPTPDDSKTSRDFAEFMMAGAFSKTVASCVAYPHEVARTRLREEGFKYRSFFQTLSTVFAEEGVRGLYRGLSTQLVRQIPNTAIVMSTYEAVVYILSRHIAPTDNEFYDKTDLEESS